MPAFSTHWLFAKELLPKIKELDEFFEINENALFFGTQGGDVFFFHRILPTMKGKSLNPIGSKIHKSKPSDLFNAMAEYLKNEDCDKNTV
ncbi:MAG: hypothetical protein K5917_01375, partial [Clostridiales bacterium]|nr:hypothetical protein [Clostridiales bacterium]